MSEKTETKSIEIIRRIRDDMANILKGKSRAEVLEFFKNAGDAAREEAKHRETVQLRAESRG